MDRRERGLLLQDERWARGGRGEVGNGNLLGDEDAGSRRVQVLGVNTIDLVTAVQVARGLVAQGTIAIGAGDVETLHVDKRQGALGAALLEVLGRRGKDIVAIVGGDQAGGRLGRVVTNRLGKVRTETLTDVGRSVLCLCLGRVGDGELVETNTCV